MPDVAQAVVHIVKRGGARTAARIHSQWDYLSRKGKIVLQRSERYSGGVLPYAEFQHWANSWAEQTGNYQPGRGDAENNQELTTHIVVSFPPGTDHEAARLAGRAWAGDMFGSGEHGGTYDYVTAFHTDRPHPHLHVVVNRRSFETNWLAISHRNVNINYDVLREVLVDAAQRYGIHLEATSREQRGIIDRPLTNEQFRQRARDAIEIREHEGHLSEDEINIAIPPERAAANGQGGSQQNAGPSSGSAPALNSEVDQNRRAAAEQQIRLRTGERERRVAEELEKGPSRRRTPGGTETRSAAAGPALDQDDAARYMDASHANIPNIDEQTGRLSRRRPGDGERSSIETRGQRIRRQVSERAERRRSRRGDDLERVIETRAQQRARLAAGEADRGRVAPSHPMELRKTAARLEQSGRNQQDDAAGVARTNKSSRSKGRTTKGQRRGRDSTR
jgi:type IV secretion system T-DNA border endonuclease VirD2